MGGMQSQVSKIFKRFIPDELPNFHKMNDRFSRYQKVKKLKDRSQLGSNDENPLQMSIKNTSNFPNTSNEEVLVETNDIVPDTTRKSTSSDDTECLTPNLEFPNGRKISIGFDDLDYLTQNFEFPDPHSIFSKPTQKFERYARTADSPDSIYLATTQKIDQDCQRFHKQGTNYHNEDFIRNCFKTSLPSKKQSFSSSSTLIFPGKSSNERQNVPILNIDDIDDFSQFVTSCGQFELPMISESRFLSGPSLNDSFNGSRKIPDVITEIYSQENATDVVVVKKPEQILIKHDLKTRSKANKRKDKENDPVMINFQQKNHTRLDDTLTLASRVQNLSPNCLTEKRDAFSSGSASPKIKKRRLNSQLPPISVNNDCDSRPLHPRGQKKEVHIVDLTEEDNENDSKSCTDEENEQNTVEESQELIADENRSAIVINNPTETHEDSFSSGSASPEIKKRRLNSQLSPILVNKDCDSRPLHPRGQKKEVHIVDLTEEDNENDSKSCTDEENEQTTVEESQELIADENRSAIVINNPTETHEDSFSSGSASPEIKKRRLNSQLSPILINKDCDSRPLHSRGQKKEVHIVDLTEEDDNNDCKSCTDEENEKNTIEEPSVVLSNNPEEKTFEKSASKVKLPKITSIFSWNAQTTTKSFLKVACDDRNQNSVPQSISDGKQSASIINDDWDVTAAGTSNLDLIVHDKQQKGSQKSIIEENPSAKVNNAVCIVKPPSESSLDVISHNRKQNALLQSMTAKNRSAIVIKDADDEMLAKSPVISPTTCDKSSHTSECTNFTQSPSSPSKLFSNRCNQSDKCLQDENLSIPDITENIKKAFNIDVPTQEIVDQIKDILTFLEADINAD